jgi:hypothetical protein
MRVALHLLYAILRHESPYANAQPSSSSSLEVISLALLQLENLLFFALNRLSPSIVPDRLRAHQARTATPKLKRTDFNPAANFVNIPADGLRALASIDKTQQCFLFVTPHHL